MRDHVALFDQSSYPVFWVSGVEALTCLQRLCANQMDVGIDQIVYTQWLNEDAGIEADVTITRTGADQFMVVSPCASEGRDWAWLRRHAREFDCQIEQDHDLAIIGVMGPKSELLLRRLFSETKAIENLTYYRSGVYQNNDLTVRMNRLSYVGERGYELYVAKPGAPLMALPHA